MWLSRNLFLLLRVWLPTRDREPASEGTRPLAEFRREGERERGHPQGDAPTIYERAW